MESFQSFLLYCMVEFLFSLKSEQKLAYSLAILNSDPVALLKPSISIPTNGTIPIESQTFFINLPCSGFRSKEVHFEFNLNVTANKFRPNPVTNVIIRRKKICLEGRPDAPLLNGGGSAVSMSNVKQTSGSSGGLTVSKGVRTSDPHNHQSSNGAETPKKGKANNGRKGSQNNNPNLTSSGNNGLVNNKEDGVNSVLISRADDSLLKPQSSIIYIILGCLVGLLFILMAIIFACYLRIKKSSSTSTTGFLHVDTSGKGSSSRCGGTGSGSSSSGAGSLFVRSESPHHYSSVSPCLGSGSYTYSSFQPNPHYTEISNSTLNSTSCKMATADITVERCKVRLQSVIMEGTFAKLYKGTVQEREGSEEQAIIKTVTDHSSPVQMALLLHEGLSLVGVTHKHIYSVIGVAAEERVPPFLIYPDEGFRNLKRFLQNCRSAPGRSITPQEIVYMAIQIASGIAYLHRQNLVHRDVATRNCVVDEKLLVKVSDGALSRDFFPEDYHWMGEAETRPVKWMPPESILQPRSSVSADIWSFGVLLWELTTSAQQPFSEIDHADLFSFLKIGYRLSQPVNCPDELYCSMSRCWTWDPDDRPKWTNVIPELQSLEAQLVQYV